jgi:transcription termination factor Rho
MTKSELESKHLAELHELAADAGVEGYRMLPRTELIEKLAGGGSQGRSKPKGERGGGGQGQRKPRDRNRKPRERQQRAPREQRGDREPRGDGEEGRREPKPEPEQSRRPEPPAAEPTTAAAPSERPKRKRRRRRWGRRAKGVRVHDLLLPAASGRQAIVYAESRAGCTTLLREVAAELSGASNGPDPIALLIDPSPEELADWKREAPQAEIVAAGKANHADDAIAQARSRAGAGEDVIVLIDSLSRFAETFAGADEARQLFDAGLGSSASSGSLTVVAAVERSS